MYADLTGNFYRPSATYHGLWHAHQYRCGSLKYSVSNNVFIGRARAECVRPQEIISQPILSRGATGRCLGFFITLMQSICSIHTGGKFHTGFLGC